ncbi:MAG TPA: methylmalonyl-CoA mutase family protein [Chloroflexota bacterium]|nr:methylmalonyl-CoA mutase family protein [Chloroflexota bacterium]
MRATTEQRAPSTAERPVSTGSDVPIQPIYRPADLDGWDYAAALGDPGAYPFTRGIYPTMYRGRLWTMRQYGGYATAAESNRRYRFLLEQGQSGLSVAFDLPTQLGYDADHPMAEGEVGRVGVSIGSVEDADQLFDGIPLERVSTSMTINATATILLALYVAAAERQGVAAAALSGTTQNDILKEYVARGTFIYPPRPSLRLITDTFAYCAGSLPRWNPISISGYHLREAGCTAAQELAFTFGNAIAYVEAALQAGLGIDAFAPRLSFFFACHNDFFEEIAKFRAARRMWARITRERFGARDPNSWRLRFHTQTAGSTLTAQQPNNNVVRVTLQALAAALGGTQSLHCNALDEALALPTQATAELALRTQQVVAYESGITATVDPLAGSYFVEKLTDDLEAQAEAFLTEIDAIGGGLAAVETGYYGRQIEESAYRHQRQIEAGERTIVGVNRFRTASGAEAAPAPELLRVDPAVRAQQSERLARLRRERDAGATGAALDRLRACAGGTENVLPALVDCARANATLGEMAGAMRDVFGEHRP